MTSRSTKPSVNSRAPRKVVTSDTHWKSSGVDLSSTGLRVIGVFLTGLIEADVARLCCLLRIRYRLSVFLLLPLPKRSFYLEGDVGLALIAQ